MALAAMHSKYGRAICWGGVETSKFPVLVAEQVGLLGILLLLFFFLLLIFFFSLSYSDQLSAVRHWTNHLFKNESS